MSTCRGDISADGNGGVSSRVTMDDDLEVRCDGDFERRGQTSDGDELAEVAFGDDFGEVSSGDNFEVAFLLRR